MSILHVNRHVNLHVNRFTCQYNGMRQFLTSRILAPLGGAKGHQMGNTEESPIEKQKNTHE